jgi:hypothetical protein
MFPSHANFFIAPFEDMEIYMEILQKADFWRKATDFYGLDLTALADKALDEKFSQPILECYDVQKK